MKHKNDTSEISTAVNKIFVEDIANYYLSKKNDTVQNVSVFSENM